MTDRKRKKRPSLSIGLSQERMRRKRVYPPCRLYSQGNPSQLIIFWSLPILEMTGRVRNCQLCDKNFAYVDFTRKHPRSVRDVIRGRLGTISKNNSRRTSLGMGYWCSSSLGLTLSLYTSVSKKEKTQPFSALLQGGNESMNKNATHRLQRPKGP